MPTKVVKLPYQTALNRVLKTRTEIVINYRHSKEQALQTV